MNEETALRAALRAVDYLLGHTEEDPHVLDAAMRRLLEAARLLPAGSGAPQAIIATVSSAIVLAASDRGRATQRLRFGWRLAVTAARRSGALHSVGSGCPMTGDGERRTEA